MHLKPKQGISGYSVCRQPLKIFSKQLLVGNGAKPPRVTHNIWPGFYTEPGDEWRWCCLIFVSPFGNDWQLGQA